MNNITPFNYGDNLIRVVNDETTGEPLWIAKDVCKVLGMDNHRQALSRLDEDEKDVISNDTLGGTQNMTVVNESGLYSLILSSRKPEAKPFKRWVTHEVLPAIRKTGSYALNQNQSIDVSPILQMMQQQNEMVLTALNNVSLVLSEIVRTQGVIGRDIIEHTYAFEEVNKSISTMRDGYHEVQGILVTQPLSPQDRQRLNSIAQARGRKLAVEYSVSTTVATQAVYAAINRRFKVATYHEIERYNLWMVLDYIDTIELS